MNNNGGVGFLSPVAWDQVNTDLEGTTLMEKPRVPKKVIIKTLKMQTSALKFMSDEFVSIQEQMKALAAEAQNTKKVIERLHMRTTLLERELDASNDKINSLENKVKEHERHIKRIDAVEELSKQNQENVRELQVNVASQAEIHDNFANETENNFRTMKEDHKTLNEYVLAMEKRLEDQQANMVLSSDQVLYGNMTLTQSLEQSRKEEMEREKRILDKEATLTAQSNNLQELMLATRQSLEENTTSVEAVQRELLEKADRTKVEETIETKYEEIIEHLQKALSSINDDEDEFKRVAQELQDLVQHLSTSKAEKKDLVEIKEQILYDSRVRQQMESLRTFIDLKMNREDVFSELENKANKEEIQAMLRDLSTTMNQSVERAVRLVKPQQDSPFLSKSSKRFIQSLPSLEKDKCLACNSVLKNPPTSKQQPPVALSMGGGFHLNLNQYQKPGKLQGLPPNQARGPVPETNSTNMLLGVDGNIYHGDSSPGAVFPAASPLPEKRQS